MQDFLDYYRRNLVHIRELSTEFAAQFPKLASQLGISHLSSRDPFVERLLEGTAFLAARVEERLDQGYARFLQSLLLRLCPALVTPQPSIALAHLEAVPDTPQQPLITTSQSFAAAQNQNQAGSIQFRPLWDCPLTRLEILDCSADSSALSALPDDVLKSTACQGCLSLKVSCRGSYASAAVSRLQLFIGLGSADVSSLMHALCCGCTGVYIRQGGQVIQAANPRIDISILGCRDNLLSDALGADDGIIFLQLYLQYPFLFNFLTITGLDSGLRSCADGQPAEIIFALDRAADLTQQIHREHIGLNCLPLINLFERRTDRVRLGRQIEHLLEVDNTAPADYEVFSVKSLEIYSRLNEFVCTALPFYSSTAAFGEGPQALFDLRRDLVPRGLTKIRSGSRKTHAWISLAGQDLAAADDRFFELCGNIWCTNADLPQSLPAGSRLSSGSGPDLNLLRIPTAALAPPFLRGGPKEFEYLSYVVMNLHAVLAQQPEVVLKVLKQLISLLDGSGQTASMELLSAESAHEVYRYVRKGSVYFENGFRVRVTLGEKDVSGSGLFIFARVLKVVLSDYSPLNLPVALEFYGEQSGLIYAYEPDSSHT